jgi:4-aminobutyrate--pyruvate transaminase
MEDPIMTLNSNSLAAKDAAYHLHGYTNAKRNEEEGGLVITRGAGVCVYDEFGKEYIDGMSALWCSALGFGEEPRLTEAAVRQFRALPYYHTFTHKVAQPTVELAEKLVRLAPVPMSKAFFANSGSEANDTIIKIVRYFNNAIGRPRKKKILSRHRAYHGVTVATASLTGLPWNHKDFDLPIEGILHTSCPHHYRFAMPGESEEAFASRCADELEALILREDPDTIAAMFAEPVMGAGGVIVPPATYFEKIQAVLRKHDILLVADEVICGFGRTGRFWGSQTFALKPDIMSMAKQLSSAVLPISAVLINQRVYEAIRDNSAKYNSFGHGITYGGHPVAAAVALETLAIYEERKIMEYAAQLAPGFLRRLQESAAHPLVGEARGVGLMGAVELVRDRATKESFDSALRVGPSLINFAQDRGLILRAIGDSIVFCPPMVATESDLDKLFDRFRLALDDALAWLQKAGQLPNAA